MTKAKHKKKRDSATFGAKQSSRFTDRLNIRCDPETKAAIIEFSEQTGMSICQIYDALTKAFLHGCQIQRDLGTRSPTINLTIERRVKRVRRYKREYVEGVMVERWFCALKGREYEWDQLPSLECPRCPNVKCREYMIKRAAGQGLGSGGLQ